MECQDSTLEEAIKLKYVYSEIGTEFRNIKIHMVIQLENYS